MTKWIGALALGVAIVQSPLISVQEALQWPNPKPLVRIPYGDDPLQFGDLRLPSGDGPHPVVVVLHGGCWRSDLTLDYIPTFADALTRLVSGLVGLGALVGSGCAHDRAVSAGRREHRGQGSRRPQLIVDEPDG